MDRSPIVLVAAADPVRPSATFVTPLGHEIEIVVVDIELVVATVVAGVGVKHGASLIPVEDAVPLPVARLRVACRVVVARAPGRDLLRGERYLIVEVEVRAA